MISVAIIPQSLEHLLSELSRMSFAPNIQINVVDGVFVSHVSWPYDPAGQPSELNDALKGKEVEVDLMVSDQVSAAKEWQVGGATGVVLHLEALPEPESTIISLRSLGLNIGLAIGNDAELGKLYPYIDSVDFVQLMGIAEIGSQGQPFDPRIFERISILHNLYPDLTISIDGGVNEQTIGELKKAGATRFIVGSTIIKATDPEKKYQELLKIIS